MKIVVTAAGTDLEAPTSPLFGRCPVYLFVDTETKSFEALENPEMDALRGAGFQAPKFVAERGARAVVSGKVGPNAFKALQAAGLPVYLFGGGTVREAVEAYTLGKLQRATAANVRTHTGEN